jgi:hypothetical protein
MFTDILYVVLVACNLVLLWYKVPAQIFLSVYGFCGFGACIIALHFLGLHLLLLAVAVLWIHGLLRYRPLLQPIVKELYAGISNRNTDKTYIRPKIDPDNIQGGFYGLKGYTNNPYDR